MAEKSVDSKVGSTVSSKSQLQNTSVSDIAVQEDAEARGTAEYPKVTGDAIPKKKSTFKITSVVTGQYTPNSRGGSGDLTADVDGDSLDDLDESHTEDFSSEMYDISRTTDLDQDALLTPDEVLIAKEKPDNQSRFKVVKIETKEPFRRGRWYCHDYLDTTEKTEKQSDEITVHSGNSSAGNSVHYIHGVDDPSKNPLLAGGTGTVPNMTATETFNSVQGESFKPINPAPHASQPVVSQVAHNQSQRQSTSGLPCDSNQIPSQVPSNTSVSQSQPGIPSVQSGVHQVPPGQSNSSQNLPLSNAQSVPLMPQSMNQTKQSDMNHSAPGPGTQTGQIINAMQPGSHYGEQGFNSQAYSMSNVPGQTSQSQPTCGQTNAFLNNAPKGSSTGESTDLSSTPSVAAPQQPKGQPTGTQSIKSTLSSGNLSGMQLNQLSGQEPNLDSISSSDISSSSTRRQSTTGIRTTQDLQNLVQDTSGIPELTGPLLFAVSGRESPAKETKDESECGTSAVAIDNKIEQAMDLVKSHLMFAVREEVEVLKEQIKELVEKISQLEYENNILRAAATPETLAKLQQQKALPPSSSS